MKTIKEEKTTRVQKHKKGGRRLVVQILSPKLLLRLKVTGEQQSGRLLPAMG
jgi:hypothetical protein